MQLTSMRRQHGITLIESLVAIVVMALGILGVVGVQMRTLSDTQNTLRRAQAIRLMESLGEQMKVAPNALASLDAYVTGWGTPPAAAADCETQACSQAELAAYDLRQWKLTVQRLLPAGDASIFVAPGEVDASNRRQLGVMIRWRENERDLTAGYTNNLDATQIRRADGTFITAGGGTADSTCPANFTCHLQYIPVAARCTPYMAGSAIQYFCPGS
ncbi:type IV pilus modification protein PilV [Pulveribacter sp.]|uniref:type IV pilus modification protein PilV n=1 Tax=Pulveribacter sp. TaxID=2678893 RepID=UPI0028A737E0|nr:type IV pilus modification protein PilV [Pulveribacter sp.]